MSHGSIARGGLGWLAAAVLAACLLLPGCSGNDSTTPVGERIDLRNGTWSWTRTVSYSGGDSCGAILGEGFDTTLVATFEDTLCSLDPVRGPTTGTEGAAPPLSRRFDCDVNQEGEAVDFLCTSLFDAGPCRIYWTLSGGGTVTDTSFDLAGTLVTEVLGDSSLCAQYVFPCTSMVIETGEYLSDAGAGWCDSLEARIPVENLIRDLHRSVPRPAATGP